MHQLGSGHLLSLLVSPAVQVLTLSLLVVIQNHVALLVSATAQLHAAEVAWTGIHHMIASVRLLVKLIELAMVPHAIDVGQCLLAALVVSILRIWAPLVVIVRVRCHVRADWLHRVMLLIVAT